MYDVAITRMGLTPTEALICEDNVRGIEAAIKSNAFVLEIGTINDTHYCNVVGPQLIESKAATATLKWCEIQFVVPS